MEKALALLPALDVNTTPPPPDVPPVITRVREIHHLDPSSTVNKLQELYGPAGLKVTEAPLRSLPFVQVSGGGTGTGSNSSSSSGSSSGSGDSGGASGGSGPTLSSSMILLTGPVAIVDNATAMLDQLDTAPRQIEIEARVLDINTTKLGQRGIRWSWTNLFSFTELGTGFRTDDPWKVGTLGRTTPLTIGAQIGAAIESGDARILAKPSIRVVEGRTARIFIGDAIRIVISRDITPTGTTIQTEEFNPGITLIVSGRSTPDGEVTLDVRPTVSVLTSLEARGTDIPLPRISERSAQTVIRMKDGETMVIGGLLQDQDVKSMTKVPGLGDLPFFGNLFRSRSIDKRRSEVVIFLTARVLKS